MGSWSLESGGGGGHLRVEGDGIFTNGYGKISIV